MAHNHLIAVEEAKLLVTQYSEELTPVVKTVVKSLGFVLAKEVRSDISLPPFNQSAMDGYAIGHFRNGAPHELFNVVGEIKAGDQTENKLAQGEAMRIFTGGMVPEGAMSVVMQELVTAEGSSIRIEGDIQPGSNIRLRGEQIQKDQVALTAGTKITPAGIGLLTSLGLTEVPVIPKPRIGLVITGNELKKPGETLNPGEIYESNSSTLISAAESCGFRVEEVVNVKDDFEATRKAIESLTEKMDMVILSGGISVGDYDYVGTALKSLDVETIFYKVKQKPGKPVLFGKNKSTTFFALPGNPAAALTCFYQYVLPSLRIMAGIRSPFLKEVLLPVKDAFHKKGDRAVFLKARTADGSVEILEGQSSAMLHTYALSDALVYLPAEAQKIEAGTPVRVHFIP